MTGKPMSWTGISKALSWARATAAVRNPGASRTPSNRSVWTARRPAKTVVDGASCFMAEIHGALTRPRRQQVKADDLLLRRSRLLTRLQKRKCPQSGRRITVTAVKYYVTRGGIDECGRYGLLRNGRTLKNRVGAGRWGGSGLWLIRIMYTIDRPT